MRNLDFGYLAFTILAASMNSLIPFSASSRPTNMNTCAELGARIEGR